MMARCYATISQGLVAMAVDADDISILLLADYPFFSLRADLRWKASFTG